MRQLMQHTITDDLDALLTTLPPHIRAAIVQMKERADLLEIVLDLGRMPEGRYPDREVILSDPLVCEEDLAYVTGRIGPFGDDNRAGIGRTLHRISAIRNRRGQVVGLTCRVGRAVRGAVALIRDVVEQGRSILILGRPGVGKTTLLREAARVLADELNKRGVGVDTSNEIAGDGDVGARGGGTQKSVLERKAPPTFDVLVEQESWNRVIVHHDVAAAVDAILRGHPPTAELRERDAEGHVTSRVVVVEPIEAPAWGSSSAGHEYDLGVFRRDEQESTYDWRAKV